MFRRPFEPLHMTGVMWQAVPPMRVRVSDLIMTNGVDKKAVKSKVRDPLFSAYGDPFIHVVEHRGRLYVADGNHRVAAARQRGDEYLVARVLCEY